MSRLRLVIFDVDGTLVDSQADIVTAMEAAFHTQKLSPPSRAEVLSIVGLSLHEAIAQLAPAAPPDKLAAMVEAYKDAYVSQRALGETSPLYPGVRDTLTALGGRDHWLLGIATGKSRRGLTAVLRAHGLESVFANEQVSDFHPSKPHPAMLQSALAETGVPAEDAVMIGDTSFDMDMAQAAGIFGIGVTWGYHPKSRLKAAKRILGDIADLPQVLEQRWGDGG